MTCTAKSRPKKEPIRTLEFTLRLPCHNCNKVNYLLTWFVRAVLEEYWPSVILVQNSLHSVCTLMGNICVAPPYVPQIPLVRVNMIVGKGIAYFRQIAIITILDA